MSPTRAAASETSCCSRCSSILSKSSATSGASSTRGIAQRANFLARSRRVFLPARRRPRYACISLHGIVLPVATIPAYRFSATSWKSLRRSASSVFSAMASSIKLCAFLPARFASAVTRALRRSGRRRVVVDIFITPIVIAIYCSAVVLHKPVRASDRHRNHYRLALNCITFG